MLFKDNAGGSGTLVAATVQLFLEYNLMGVYSQMSEAAFFQFVSGLLWAKWQFNKRVYIYCSLGPRGQISGSPKERGPRRTLGLTVERERGSWSIAAVINEGSFLFEVCTFKVALIKV